MTGKSQEENDEDLNEELELDSQIQEFYEGLSDDTILLEDEEEFDCYIDLSLDDEEFGSFMVDARQDDYLYGDDSDEDY